MVIVIPRTTGSSLSLFTLSGLVLTVPRELKNYSSISVSHCNFYTR